MSEEARVTPSHPVVSVLAGLSLPPLPRFIIPLSSLVFGFQSVKPQPEQTVAQRMKDAEGRGQTMRKMELGKDSVGEEKRSSLHHIFFYFTKGNSHLKTSFFMYRFTY